MDHPIAAVVPILSFSLLANVGGADEKQWHDVLANSIVFGAQADLHSFNRIPRPYMMSVLADLPKVQADFFAVCGDLVAAKTGLDLARESPVPVFFVYGDHENFEEWGYIRQKGLVPARGRGGWRRHDGGVFNAMCSDMPLTQAWTGLPYFWSLNYKGIHFVFAYSGKNHTTPSWFLQWLKRDLDEHRDRTTVLFTHRGLLEFGERWNLPQQWEDIIKAAPHVKLIVYGHYHYPRAIDMLGQALTIDCDLPPDFPGRKGESFQDGSYGLFSVAADAIRIWARYPETGKMTLIHEQKVKTTFQAQAESALSLPYLMSQGSRHYLPALKLRDAKLRLWGVTTEQLVPNSLLDARGPIPWQPLGQVTLKPVDVNLNSPPLSRILEVRIANAGNSTESPARLARLDISNVRFDQQAISDRMVSVENAYSALLLVKAPAGRNVWLIMDTLKPDGEVEASYATKVKSEDPNRLHYVFQQVYASYVRSKKSWVWCPGPKGRGDTDIAYDVPGPRQANKLALYLATPDKVANETWQAALFVYLTDAPYAPAPGGRSHTQNLRLDVNGQPFAAKELREGSPQASPLAELIGGAPFSVTSCEGSRLALVEFKGRTDGLMHFNLRQLTEKSAGAFTVGDSCGGEPNPATEGLSILTLFRPLAVDGKPSVSRKSLRRELSDGLVIGDR